ncbi:hypothetical protein PAHAL_9G514100 [Panicum hallii]|uniref:Myb/SANT-like domain-containing protein n=1 Tax=Panicum hallii TaxID=206008 RepID=A0A2T8I5D6_9POAL|nr:uncharacterized protein LOC112874539 [Panicum hallii]PVH32882.1 hypothetical protein PAHAL_9G514100 [Panicum hallii]
MKTSTGFKQVHLNGCARALMENMGYHVTGTQVGNHLRKWKKIYGKIQKLKNLSGALWDEETCTISLEREHYLAHIQIHRDDAKYLNCPIEHYHEMATIFGNSLATGAYAKGASDPLASEVTATANASQETKDGAETNEQGEGSPLEAEEMTFSANTNGAGSSGTKPPAAKKHKVAAVEDPNIAMVSIMSEGLGNLAAAIEKVGKEDDGIPEGLYDDMMSIPGFDEAHLDHYYAYLCEHPSLARRFYNMRLSSKMVWVARYIKEHL